ncbi:helix-turn-helix domain-containing protein [Nocardia mikamii]|uniref:helix-turn-helix domain-containing protein n=1 Tax=Nocardia mikamii TaxID=508464 RepID=UPI0007A37916|nr:helix-turn-helix transcriptional regulator [Nocardia mikamii]
MTVREPHLRELGEFLKARRAQLEPGALGLPSSDLRPRRVPGLRREEVAELAAISTDYYTRIEQGRLAPSEPVLDTLVRVLQLDREQRDYVRSLAERADSRPSAPRGRQVVRAQLGRLLEQLTDTPALIFGRHLDILAWNQLAAALIADFGKIPQKQRNYVRMIFLDPAMRRLYTDWEAVARTCVAILRMEAAANPTDPRLTALVGELSVADEQFRQWWAARHVAHQEFGTKRMSHPEVGDLVLEWDTFRYSGDPDQQLVLWSTEPGSVSQDKLRILASWSVEHLPASETSEEHRTL